MAYTTVHAETARVAPEVRRIHTDDIQAALRAGLDDFRARPSHLFFLGLIYPVCGLVLVQVALNQSLLPLLFPLVSGFALMGPFIALGLYDISRRREQGLEIHWTHAIPIAGAPRRGGLWALGGLLAAFFMAWLAAAYGLFQQTSGLDVSGGTLAFFTAVLTSVEGLKLIVVGHLLGFGFAAVVLATTVVAFPLMLDRPEIGPLGAVATSLRAVARNPKETALWGLIVAAALVAGTLALFVGLALVMPILGHSSWHLYRRLVVAS
ncbi:putative membrane protein [Rhodothalassium salexigens DSM 2132]|uniref:Putative membrane protein n=1 Tax=Rhodothalassium salexigens DSM 2132 TaxID=1188247 RepID=A0A4R2PS31_RHOSA|nr:DUF2189 domain-containing protein [Rhodothalassium salexigens]MBB4210559.1 putative membrane protein [Rhodothalassium salexigens DSM 2132]MBK1638032.1 hypothetical protein [Rhodothalassium salexigens DSM 2132]TCP37884.1 putative membrane protein [Rhodothalassium salexigens DSM 2132]